MTLLDRFRSQQPQRHPDPDVRLAYVAEIPLSERDVIATIAREDAEPRVRRAAVAKLLDPAILAVIAREDVDDQVRSDAVAMLRDLALDSFEDVAQADGLAAVEALQDVKALVQIAKGSAREEIALPALTRVSESHLLASIARHAALESVRQGAFARLQDHDDVLSVAMNGEFKDTAVAAVATLSSRDDLEQVAARSRNKSAAKRARSMLRELDERSAASAGESSAPIEPEPVRSVSAVPLTVPSFDEEDVDANAAVETLAREREAAAKRAQAEKAAAEARHLAEREADRRRGRLVELALEAQAIIGDADLVAARRRLGLVRREWMDLTVGFSADPEMVSRVEQVETRLAEREAQARQADARLRHDGLNRLLQLLGRVESIVQKPGVPLKALERALREVRVALAELPPLPSKDDVSRVTGRLKAAQAALMPKIQELREIIEWQRWANLGIQEQLCEKMEALRSLDDPEEIARRIRTLQQQWRQAADAPRPQGEAHWRRFKAAHDELWLRCEAHFAAQAEARAANLARKTELCERAEALADSTNWLQTAAEIKSLQAEWKAIGQVTRGQEKAIWERFRASCDRFFTRRHDDLVARKAMWAENLVKKEALCQKVETLADSSDWEEASAEIRRLQAEWKTIGPVKKNRSEAIWQRFRGACDRFFTRYARRHDLARAERSAARETLCAEIEALADGGGGEPQDVLATLRSLRGRWQQELALCGVNREGAAELDRRFEEGFSRVVARWPEAFAGSELDPDANRRRMETLVKRLEDLADSLGGPDGADAGLSNASPTAKLAVMLRDALAANTIGGRVDVDRGRRAALEELRQAQASWSRIGPVPEEKRRMLAERFQRACVRIQEKAGRQEGRKVER
jgi:hypothetical protein